ncbi:MAG: hypothetical protein V3V08_26075 [Nannocystaceae bacterium]
MGQGFCFPAFVAVSGGNKAYAAAMMLLVVPPEDGIDPNACLSWSREEAI